MKRVFQSITAMLFFLFIIPQLNSQVNSDVTKILGDSIKISKFDLSNNHMGTEFWVSFHPVWELYERENRIFIISLRKATVNIEPTGGGNRVTRLINPNEWVQLSTKKGEINFNWSLTDGETITNNGYHITSDEPIGVFVYTSDLQYAGEGYQALPVSAWGSEYFNFSYYDFLYTGNGQHHPGGFIVIASEDQTSVTIDLKGMGYGYATTKAGKKIGEQIKVTLGAGQTYMVAGDNKTTGVFDLTGSRITSSKPVAVVSFHEFSCLTSYCTNFGNYMDEMLLPTFDWGTKYATIQFTRTGTVQNLGDYFRAIGCQDNTTMKVKYYNISTNALVGQKQTTLKKAGDFFDFFDGSCGNIQSINGLSVWESDKPMMVMQYSYSHMWDGDLNWSPVMIQLNPLSQYARNIAFLVPPDFPSEMDLLVVRDTTTKDTKLLESVKLDGEQFSRKTSSILYNQITGTNLNWAKYTVPVGMHTLESDTKMAGFISHPRPSCVGWYLGMTLNKIDEPDSVPPQLTITGSCGNFIIDATEKTNGKPFPGQIDQGISKIVLVPELSDNFKLTLEKPELFKPQLKITKQRFYLDVIDKYKMANAVFCVIDRAGNIAIDSIKYEPDLISFEPNLLDFLNIRVKSEKDSILQLINTGSKPLTVNKISFMKGIFKLNCSDSINIIQPGDKKPITICYIPQAEQKTQKDCDTLKVVTTCSEFSTAVLGRGVMPHIRSNSIFDFGDIEKDKKLCIEDKNSYGFRIENPGTGDLIITKIKNIIPPFSIQDPCEPPLPLTISPSGFTNIKTICFAPTDSGSFSNDMIIVSNADSAEIAIKLTGNGFIKTDVFEPKVNIVNDFLLTSSLNNEFINITYNIDNNSNVLLEIFDITGIHRKTLVNEYQESGSHSCQLSLISSQINTGVYFLKLTYGSIVRTKIFIVSQ